VFYLPGVKKIGIFLGSDPGSGGMFQYSLAVLEALSALPRDRYEIVAAFFCQSWKSYIAPLGVRPMPLGATGREPLTLGGLWRSACLPAGFWRKHLSRFDPVVCAIQNENCDLWFFPAQDHWSYMTPVSAVTTIHDLMHRYEPQFPEVSRWGRYFLREYRFSNICQYANVVLVDSHVGGKHVTASYGLTPDRLFSLPYLPPRYIYNFETPEDFDAKYKLPSRFLFYPAQFWLHKNHDRLLRAVANVKRTCPDIFLVLTGSKRYEYQTLTRRVAEYDLRNHVMFTGYVPDVYLPEFYRRARALVMPTFFGPTNIPPLEAFVLGCPVAVSNVYGMSEQVGDAALLFQPDSVQDIFDVIVKLWTDDQLCKDLINQGNKRAERWGQSQFNTLLGDLVANVLMHTGKDY